MKALKIVNIYAHSSSTTSTTYKGVGSSIQSHHLLTDSHMLPCGAQNIMLFNTAEDLRPYLKTLSVIYEPYAAGVWELGIRD